MNDKPDPSIAPEYLLADRFLQRFPRAGQLDPDQLRTVINWNDISDREFYKNYQPIAMELLLEEKYIERTSGGYKLTNAGRRLKDDGGLISLIQERREDKRIEKKGKKAEVEQKDFQNKVKVVLFVVTILTAVVGVLGKCISDSGRAKPDTAGPVKDSVVKHSAAPGAESTSVSPKRHHPRNTGTVSREPVVTRPEGGSPEAGSPASEKKSDAVVKSDPLPVVSKPSGPLQTETTDNIQFKVMSVEGSPRAQTIHITVVLTTSAANWTIYSRVQSIFDNDGNEYMLKSFAIGANTYLHDINMTTGIPLKCSFLFAGVLPAVRQIRLFKFSYLRRDGHEYAVEFRDLPVDWQ